VTRPPRPARERTTLGEALDAFRWGEGPAEPRTVASVLDEFPWDEDGSDGEDGVRTGNGSRSA